MGILRRRRPTTAAHTTPPDPTSATAHAEPGRTVSRVWSDGLGVLATRAAQLLLVLIVVAAVVIGMRTLSVVVIPVLLALIIASAFAPVMRWLRRRGLPPLLATVLALLAIVVALGGTGFLIVLAVRDQWDMLASQAVEGFKAVVDWTQHLPIAFDPAQIDEWLETAKDFVFSARFGSGAIAGVSAVATFLTGLVLLVVVLFFFLKDGPQLWDFMLRPFRGAQEARARRIGTKTVDTFGSYIRGTAAVAAVDAIGIGIGLAILQVPLALPLAVLVFLLAFIPIVGATLAGILAALVALVSNGLLSAVIVVGIVILVNQLEGNFLQPVLMAKTLRLHALVVLIALAVGTLLGGIVGAIIAVPITAVAWGIVGVWDGENLPARWARRRPTTP